MHRTLPVLCRSAAFAVLGCLLASTVCAGDDIVTLTGGSRITGTIRELSRGRLEFSIDGVEGRSRIDWRNVESLESAQRFEIVLSSGERLSGTIANLSMGRLDVQTDVGPRTLERDDIVFMRSVGASFADRLEGSIDLGLDFLSAGDEIDWTLNAEATHRTRDYVLEASINSLVREKDEAPTQRRNHFELLARRLLEQRWFVLSEFIAEEDKELELDSRFLIGVAAGRTLVQSNRTMFAIYGGFDVSREKFVGLDTDNVPEALASVEWDWFEFAGNLDLELKATTYYSLDDSRVRADVGGSIRHDIFSSYYVSLNVYESYNSDPPEGVEKSDFAVMIAFGRSF